MYQLEQAEQLVESLPPEDFARFRDWFLELDWKVWDEKIERDSKAGKLSHLTDKLMLDYEAGQGLVVPMFALRTVFLTQAAEQRSGRSLG